MSLELAADVMIRETRTSRLHYSTGMPTDWEVMLTVEQESSMALHAPADSKLVVVELDTGNETVFEDADVAWVDHPVGNVVIERYVMGARNETHEVAVPPFEGEVSTPANDFIDYRLFAGNSELHKNVYRAWINNNYLGNSAIVESRYETTVTDATDINTSAIDLVATPKSSLPAGRYEVAASPSKIAIDLYPQGVVIGHYAGHTARLLPYWTNGKVFYGAVGTIDISFNPKTNFLANSIADATLTVAQRVK